MHRNAKPFLAFDADDDTFAVFGQIRALGCYEERI
jgi:hypothetical protein